LPGRAGVSDVPPSELLPSTDVRADPHPAAVQTGTRPTPPARCKEGGSRVLVELTLFCLARRLCSFSSSPVFLFLFFMNFESIWTSASPRSLRGHRPAHLILIRRNVEFGRNERQERRECLVVLFQRRHELWRMRVRARGCCGRRHVIGRLSVRRGYGCELRVRMVKISVDGINGETRRNLVDGRTSPTSPLLWIASYCTDRDTSSPNTKTQCRQRHAQIFVRDAS